MEKVSQFEQELEIEKKRMLTIIFLLKRVLAFLVFVTRVLKDLTAMNVRCSYA